MTFPKAESARSVRGTTAETKPQMRMFDDSCLASPLRASFSTQYWKENGEWWQAKWMQDVFEERRSRYLLMAWSQDLAQGWITDARATHVHLTLLLLVIHFLWQALYHDYFSRSSEPTVQAYLRLNLASIISSPSTLHAIWSVLAGKHSLDAQTENSWLPSSRWPSVMKVTSIMIRA